MRKTSANYNPFPVVRDVDCLISFGVMDQNADKETVVISTNDDGVFSNIRAAVNDVHKASGCWAALFARPLLHTLNCQTYVLKADYATR